MTDKEKVLTALKKCNLYGDCTECPYLHDRIDGDCVKRLTQDAIAVINQIAKERDEAIAQLRPAVGREREEEGE